MLEGLAILPHEGDASRWSRLGCAGKALLRGHLVSGGLAPQRGLRREVSRQVRAFAPDVIHVDNLGLMQLIEARHWSRVVLNHHNVESHMMRRRAANQGPGWRRWYFNREAAHLDRLERTVAPGVPPESGGLASRCRSACVGGPWGAGACRREWCRHGVLPGPGHGEAQGGRARVRRGDGLVSQPSGDRLALRRDLARPRCRWKRLDPDRHRSVAISSTAGAGRRRSTSPRSRGSWTTCGRRLPRPRSTSVRSWTAAEHGSRSSMPWPWNGPWCRRRWASRGWAWRTGGTT